MIQHFYLLCFLLIPLPICDAQSTQENADNTIEEYFEPVKWRCIGPFRGGRSVAACGTPGNKLTYYMGTTGGGLWKTEDAGQRWTNISDGYFKTGSVGAVAVAPSDPNIVYCGMGEHAPRGVMTSYGDGVYKSTDAGKTWTNIGLTKTQHIARIVVHPKNPEVVYVAAQGQLYGPNEERGIYKSVDGGNTWKKMLYINSNTGCSELSMDMTNPRILYAAMWHHQRLPWKVISGGEGSGLYKSVDGGESWTKIEEGLPDELGKMAVSVCRSNPDRVYALVESDSQQEKGGLFVSTNGGKSWTRVSKDHRLVQRAWYYIEVFADPQDENTVYVLSAPALRSIDGGKTWERITGTHGDFHDLWINPEDPTNLCIANDGGAAISFNRGKTWSTQANMPTAQFYRINVDNLFPYNIYGGQQDNSSVKIAHREFDSGGITPKSWESSAGGESAFLAFDPDNPRYVLGGSYLGTIEILDTEAKAGTRIMAAPIQYLGRAASDMKYRYNWNAPIIWSQHDENTYYHAAQMLLRTRDNGLTWEEVSPDLSKNEKERQIKGGGPYTVEAVGAENYGTISYVAESPHEAGVIWIATDDGHVQLTRDNCETWQNVTPAGLDDCLVNAIDISPHDPATAYIATTRYKFNDHTPALYKTNNYGQSWTNISKGIPHGAFTRVVREDNVRRGLLFAGTETGIYISLDDGASWKRFQLNMPVTPILDLIIRHGDIAVATSGRSFWVLDDLSLIRQFADDGTTFKLFDPEDVYLVNGSSELNGSSSNFKGTNPNHGVNPATGAVFYYELPEEGKSVTVEIRNEEGLMIRELSSVKDTTYRKWDGGPPAAPTLKNAKGLNRLVWDLRNPIMPGVPDVYIEGSYRGHKVPPGVYSITLKSGEKSESVDIEVLQNPMYSTTSEQYAEYSTFMRQAEKSFVDMHNMVNALWDARKKITSILSNLPEAETSGKLRQQGLSLSQKILNWDSEMVQRKSKAYDDVENFENKFTANYLFMINQTQSDLPRVNQSSLERRSELNIQWGILRATGEQILNVDIPKFNKMLWDAGIGPVWVKQKATKP